MAKEEVFKKYRFAKMNVQMNEAHLEGVNVNKYTDMLKGDYTNEINFGIKAEELNVNQYKGYLKTNIDCINQDTEEIVLHIEVIYSGVFSTTGEWEEDEFYSWVEVQIVPQLLSYCRSVITNITSMMNIPPIEIPTMDVIQSLEENGQLNSSEEE